MLGGLCIGRGAPGALDHLGSDNPAVMTSAGRLHLTLADWATLLRRVFLVGGDLLCAESIEHLLRVPTDGKRTMTMGWAPTVKIDGASYGMQGSNTIWAATALLSATRDRAALVATNDGRTRVFTKSAKLAASLLDAS